MFSASFFAFACSIMVAMKAMKALKAMKKAKHATSAPAAPAPKAMKAIKARKTNAICFRIFRKLSERTKEFVEDPSEIVENTRISEM